MIATMIHLITRMAISIMNIFIIKKMLFGEEPTNTNFPRGIFSLTDKINHHVPFDTYNRSLIPIM